MFEMSYIYTLSDCTTAVYNKDNIMGRAAPKMFDIAAPAAPQQSRAHSTASAYHTSPFANSLSSPHFIKVSSPVSLNGSTVLSRFAEPSSPSISVANSTASRRARYSHDPYNLSASSAGEPTAAAATAVALSPEESFSACYGGDAVVTDSGAGSREASPAAARKSPAGAGKKRRQPDGPSARPQPSGCTVVPHTTKRAPAPRRGSPASEAEACKDPAVLAAFLPPPVAEVSLRANVLSFFQSAALHTPLAEQSSTSNHTSDHSPSDSPASQGGARAVRTVVTCGRVDRTSGRPVVRALTAQ